MRKRLLSIAMALCMVLTLLPATAFADENPETPVCTCKEACTAETMNTECAVCGAEGAAVKNCCKYVAPAKEEPAEPVKQPEAPTCTCEEACTVEAMNTECTVCGAEGASVENCCKYVALAKEEPEPEPEQTAVEKVQAMINALPTVENLEDADDETVDEVYAAVQDVCDALDELGEEELDQITGLDKLAALMEWFTGAVSTYEGEDYPYLNYTIEDNGTITITGLKDGYKDTTDVTIPAKIGSYDVTAIGGWSFEDCKNITRVNLPASITTIGKNAFKNCTNLESINIPYGVTSIGWYAFAGCTKLASITIPSSVTLIDTGVFENCTGLTSITIPSSVTQIGYNAFNSCTGLTSITIPSSVTEIAGYAFANCTSLTSVTIPSSVTQFYDGIFNGCTGLTSVTIPSSMTIIPYGTFSGCTGLTSITIPNSVTSIGYHAFAYCSGVNDVYYLGTEEEWERIFISSYNDALSGKVRYVGDITQGFAFTPPSNLTYDGNAKEATVTKNNQDYGAFTIKYYDQNGQVYTTGPIDAGTYTVKIDIEQSQTYDAISGYEVGRFTILQAENSFTTDLSIEGWTYGDTPKAPNAAAKFGELTYSYSTEEDGIYTTTQPTNAGTYWVKAKVDETDNYTGLEAKIQFTILPKTYTVTYAAGSYGTGTVTAGSKTHDVAFTLSSDIFTRAGYEQTGWAISDGGEKVYDLGGTYTANEDITLYPVWSHEHTDAEPKDHICDVCGAALSQHTGGEATCIDRAICDYCGEEYGEIDSTNHNLEKVPAKAATVTETGNIEYWQCKDCDDIFSDPDGKDKIELEDTVIEKLPPEIIKGKGQSIAEGEKKALSFTSNAAFSDFICVEIDGKTLDEKNYTVKEGSTIVALKADYVAILSAGKHTIGIVSESGTATTTFTVKEKTAADNDTKAPETGDSSRMALWIALLLISGGLLTVMEIYGKKKKYNK